MKIKINDITITVDEELYNPDWGEREIVNEITETVHEYSEHCDYDYEETRKMLVDDYWGTGTMSEEDINRLCDTLDLNRR